MELKLPAGEFSAYLFDCDGTIADSMPLHYIAWKAVFDEWNCEFPEDQFYSWGGRPVAEVIRAMNQMHGLHMPVEETRRRKEQMYMDRLADLKPVPGVLEHIEASYGRVPFAVVSGGTRDVVEASLRAIHLLDRFETLVCMGDYQRGKPDPEPFLLAAERLGVRPGACLVFEDGDMGIQAAEAAGMAVVRVPLPWERATL